MNGCGRQRVSRRRVGRPRSDVRRAARPERDWARDSRLRAPTAPIDQVSVGSIRRGRVGSGVSDGFRGLVTSPRDARAPTGGRTASREVVLSYDKGSQFGQEKIKLDHTSQQIYIEIRCSIYRKYQPKEPSSLHINQISGNFWLQTLRSDVYERYSFRAVRSVESYEVRSAYTLRIRR
ncbi:unnamed protein product [Leptosia nina]|uniref:Uncharacterized protein n=1 Tax=Leptosia nina TaxID=320188 RepID=A0AAV1K4H7_9NEOP